MKCCNHVKNDDFCRMYNFELENLKKLLKQVVVPFWRKIHAEDSEFLSKDLLFRKLYSGLKKAKDVPR